MTGYQKLKVENDRLWKELETCLKAMTKDETLVKKLLNNLKWEIKKLQHEDKD